MKNSLALLLILILVAGYQWHMKTVNTAASEAAARAREAALPRTPAPAPIHAVSISRSLEPMYADLFADLDRTMPLDLVPPLEIVRERILDKKVLVEPAKRAVYDLGNDLAVAMIDVAEERTKALRSLLETTARGKSSLDTTHSTTTTGAFFAQSAVKRWDEERRRRRSQTDQLFVRVRNAEREWNQRLPTDAAVDSFDPPTISPPTITVDFPTGSASSLEIGTYGRSTNYSWRRSYYNQSGYPRPTQ